MESNKKLKHGCVSEKEVKENPKPKMKFSLSQFLNAINRIRIVWDIWEFMKNLF